MPLLFLEGQNDLGNTANVVHERGAPSWDRMENSTSLRKKGRLPSHQLDGFCAHCGLSSSDACFPSQLDVRRGEEGAVCLCIDT